MSRCYDDTPDPGAPIFLTEDEAAWADDIGRQQREHDVKHGYTEYSDLNDAGAMAISKLGARTELAAHRFRYPAGVEWKPRVKPDSEPDVDGMEVRGSEHPNGNLCLKKRDRRNNKLHRPFISVIAKSRHEYVIAGWIIGNDGVQDKWKRKGTPDYWLVPVAALRPFFPAVEGASRRMLRSDELDAKVIHLDITPGGQVFLLEHRIMFAIIHALCLPEPKPIVEPELFDSNGAQ